MCSIFRFCLYVVYRVNFDNWCVREVYIMYQLGCLYSFGEHPAIWVNNRVKYWTEE